MSELRTCNEPPKCAKEPEILVSIQSLDDTITALLDALNHLESRLQKAMLPQDPVPQEEINKRQPSCDIADSLWMKVAAIEAALKTIANIQSRLEL